MLLRFDRRWVRYAPLTSSGNVIAAGMLARPRPVRRRARRPRLRRASTCPDWVTERSLAIAIPVAVAVFLVAFLVLGAVFSVLGYLVTNWGFTLSRDARGRSFHVRRGLLTTPRPASSATGCAASR